MTSSSSSPPKMVVTKVMVLDSIDSWTSNIHCISTTNCWQSTKLQVVYVHDARARVCVYEYLLTVSVHLSAFFECNLQQKIPKRLYAIVCLLDAIHTVANRGSECLYICNILPEDFFFVHFFQAIKEDSLNLVAIMQNLFLCTSSFRVTLSRYTRYFTCLYFAN